MHHLIHKYRYQSSTTLTRPERALAEHHNIFSVIEEHDGTLVEMLMRRHISGARKNIEQQVLYEES